MAEVVVEPKFAEMTHGKTRYYEAGAGPALLLVHGAGFLSGGQGWLPVIPGLAEHFHLYAVDCLGFGPGDPIEQPYSFAYLVDHLREFQDVIGLSSSHVIGHSMGGWLGVLLAYESPNRIDRFVNVAGGGVATRPLATMVGWQPPEESAIREAFARLGGTNIDPETLIEERIEILHRPANIEGFRRLMDHMTNPETRARYNTQRRLPLITTPTLVLWGAEDKTNALELGQQTHDLLPGSEFVVFEGVGHAVPQEAPERFVETVTEFLLR
jgi:pimeloyl-ACP methyl ester carboxylesterase